MEWNGMEWNKKRMDIEGKWMYYLIDNVITENNMFTTTV